jgi:hypothetical protein
VTGEAAVSSAPPERDEAGALEVVRPVAPFLERVVFTRNRRVMVSLAGRGRVLRIDAGFAAAPAAVLVAAAGLFAARDRRQHRSAREAVRAFIRTLPGGSPAPARPRRRVTAPGDAPHLERLSAEFDRVNAAAFDGALPTVPLFLSARMRRRNGHFSSSPLEIVLARALLVRAAPGEAEATLRHEMIHLWQHVAGLAPGHGREFRAWARRLDVHPRATRPVAWIAR